MISSKIPLNFIPKGPINNISFDNGSAQTKWQAIICNNDDYFTDAYMRRSASITKSPLKLSQRWVTIFHIV